MWLTHVILTDGYLRGERGKGEHLGEDVGLSLQKASDCLQTVLLDRVEVRWAVNIVRRSLTHGRNTDLSTTTTFPMLSGSQLFRMGSVMASVTPLCVSVVLTPHGEDPGLMFCLGRVGWRIECRRIDEQRKLARCIVQAVRLGT